MWRATIITAVIFILFDIGAIVYFTTQAVAH
jgi:hypothetical protein